MVDAHMVDAHIRHCPTLMVDARHVNDRQDTQQHQQEGTLSHTGIWTILISVELPSLQYILLYKHSTNYWQTWTFYKFHLCPLGNWALPCSTTCNNSNLFQSWRTRVVIGRNWRNKKTRFFPSCEIGTLASSHNYVIAGKVASLFVSKGKGCKTNHFRNGKVSYGMVFCYFVI